MFPACGQQATDGCSLQPRSHKWLWWPTSHRSTWCASFAEPGVQNYVDRVINMQQRGIESVLVVDHAYLMKGWMRCWYCVWLYVLKFVNMYKMWINYPSASVSGCVDGCRIASRSCARARFRTLAQKTPAAKISAQLLSRLKNLSFCTVINDLNRLTVSYEITANEIFVSHRVLPMPDFITIASQEWPRS
jgi:hypothetical protein